MRLGVVSDSHGHVECTRPAIRMLESLQVDRVLHCGDIGSAAVVEMFAAWPTDFVFGNCDERRAELATAIEAAGQTCHGAFGELEIAGKRIALIHSDDRRRFQQTIQSGDFDLV
jgi:putative phosphoesterase